MSTTRRPTGGVSRRRVLQGLGGIGAAAVLAACGGTDPATGSGPGGAPVRLEHKFGVTEIPGRPERVVTVGLTEQDDVVALGGVLVGTREWFGEQPGGLWPWARARLGGAPLPTVLPREPLDVERVAALRPDLILAMNSGIDRQQYDLLSRLAPVVAQPVGFPDYGAPWQLLTRTSGRALGRDAEAERLVADVEGRFTQVRAATPQLRGATGLLASSIGGAAYVYVTGPAPRFLSQLGLAVPPAVTALSAGDPDAAPVQLSTERLDVLDASVVLLGLYEPAASSVAANPLFAGRRVAREGRVVTLPEESELNGALSFSSALSLPLVLDGLVPRIAAALNGDPATVPAAV